MRVQAKNINLTILKYEHLYHQNKHGYQVDLLIDDAAKNGLIPLYCLYTNWDASRHRAGRICLNCKPSIRHYGTSVLSAKSVKNFLPKKIMHLDSLIGYLKPMHCILCAKTKPSKGDLPQRCVEYLRRNKIVEAIGKIPEIPGALEIHESPGIQGVQEVGKVEKKNNNDLFLKQTPPQYIMQLLEKTYDIRSNALDNSKLFHNHLQIDDQRLKHITIIKEN